MGKYSNVPFGGFLGSKVWTFFFFQQIVAFGFRGSLMVHFCLKKFGGGGIVKGGIF